VLGGVVQYPGAMPLLHAGQVSTLGLVAKNGAAKHSVLKNGAASVAAPEITAVRLGAVTMLNQTGALAEVYTMLQSRTNVTTLNPGTLSGALNGSLLNIDLIRAGVRYSYDLTRFMPNGVLVAAESPYQLQQVLDHDGRTLVLVISDNTGEEVGSFRPAGILPVGARMPELVSSR
jgi:hypothetical protein